MQVLKYLETKTLQELQDEFSIKVSHNPKYPDLIVLNYDQIDSPKNHPITNECRSLVLSQVDGEFALISAAFDRFYNYGENGENPKVASTDRYHKIEAYEKMDGSIISVFWYKGEWLYRTRSQIMPEGLVMEGVWWDWFIKTALDWEWFEKELLSNMSIRNNDTLIFEVTGKANRVVVKYDDRPKATLLAIRTIRPDTSSPTYLPLDGFTFGFNRPKSVEFESVEQLQAMAHNLPNLEEGYVIYKNNAPFKKIKSEKYMAAHRMGGVDNLMPKHVRELVVTNEYDEYLAIKPDQADELEPYIVAWKMLQQHITNTWDRVRDIEDRKEFSLAIKGESFSSVLFKQKQTGKQLGVLNSLSSQRIAYRAKLLEDYMKSMQISK